MSDTDRRPEATEPVEQELHERTCAGCRAIGERDELVRIAALTLDGELMLVPDLGHKLGGRGISIHPRRSCLRDAVRRGGFAKALRREVKADPEALSNQIRSQLERRIEGLLMASLRRRELALGTDAVRDAMATGAAQLLLVAKDAAGRRGDLLEQANTMQVPVIELFDKATLGRLSGKETLGFLAVLERRMAREISASARWLAGLSEDG